MMETSSKQAPKAPAIEKLESEFKALLDESREGQSSHLSTCTPGYGLQSLYMLTEVLELMGRLRLENVRLRKLVSQPQQPPSYPQIQSELDESVQKLRESQAKKGVKAGQPPEELFAGKLSVTSLKMAEDNHSESRIAKTPSSVKDLADGSSSLKRSANARSASPEKKVSAASTHKAGDKSVAKTRVKSLRKEEPLNSQKGHSVQNKRSVSPIRVEDYLVSLQPPEKKSSPKGSQLEQSSSGGLKTVQQLDETYITLQLSKSVECLPSLNQNMLSKDEKQKSATLKKPKQHKITDRLGQFKSMLQPHDGGTTRDVVRHSRSTPALVHSAIPLVGGADNPASGPASSDVGCFVQFELPPPPTPADFGGVWLGDKTFFDAALLAPTTAAEPSSDLTNSASNAESKVPTAQKTKHSSIEQSSHKNGLSPYFIRRSSKKPENKESKAKLPDVVLNATRSGSHESRQHSPPLSLTSRKSSVKPVKEDASVEQLLSAAMGSKGDTQTPENYLQYVNHLAIDKDFVKRLEEWNTKKGKDKSHKDSKAKTQKTSRSTLVRTRSKSAERAPVDLDPSFKKKLRSWEVKKGLPPNSFGISQRVNEDWSSDHDNSHRMLGRTKNDQTKIQESSGGSLSQKFTAPVVLVQQPSFQMQRSGSENDIVPSRVSAVETRENKSVEDLSISSYIDGASHFPNSPRRCEVPNFLPICHKDDVYSINSDEHLESQTSLRFLSPDDFSDSCLEASSENLTDEDLLNKIPDLVEQVEHTHPLLETKLKLVVLDDQQELPTSNCVNKRFTWNASITDPTILDGSDDLSPSEKNISSRHLMNAFELACTESSVSPINNDASVCEVYKKSGTAENLAEIKSQRNDQENKPLPEDIELRDLVEELEESSFITYQNEKRFGSESECSLAFSSKESLAAGYESVSTTEIDSELAAYEDRACDLGNCHAIKAYNESDVQSDEEYRTGSDDGTDSDCHGEMPRLKPVDVLDHYTSITSNIRDVDCNLGINLTSAPKDTVVVPCSVNNDSHSQGKPLVNSAPLASNTVLSLSSEQMTSCDSCLKDDDKHSSVDTDSDDEYSSVDLCSSAFGKYKDFYSFLKSSQTSIHRTAPESCEDQCLLPVNQQTTGTTVNRPIAKRRAGFVNSNVNTSCESVYSTAPSSPSTEMEVSLKERLKALAMEYQELPGNPDGANLPVACKYGSLPSRLVMENLSQETQPTSPRALLENEPPTSPRDHLETQHPTSPRDHQETKPPASPRDHQETKPPTSPRGSQETQHPTYPTEHPENLPPTSPRGRQEARPISYYRGRTPSPSSHGKVQHIKEQFENVEMSPTSRRRTIAAMEKASKVVNVVSKFNDVASRQQDITPLRKVSMEGMPLNIDRSKNSGLNDIKSIPTWNEIYEQRKLRERPQEGTVQRVLNRFQVTSVHHPQHGSDFPKVSD